MWLWANHVFPLGLSFFPLHKIRLDYLYNPFPLIVYARSWQSFSAKGQIANRFCRARFPCHNYSTMTLQHKNSCRQYVNEEAWLHSNNTLFTKQMMAWFWPMGLSLLTPALCSNKGFCVNSSLSFLNQYIKNYIWYMPSLKMSLHWSSLFMCFNFLKNLDKAENLEKHGPGFGCSLLRTALTCMNMIETARTLNE